MAESSNIVGNVYDKYASRNPIARALMNGFLGSVTELYTNVKARSVLEVGCGEGALAHHLVSQGARPERFEACDLDLAYLAPNTDSLIKFSIASIYELPYDDGEFDLVVCCEVLEHLEDPAAGLKELARVANRAVLLSTPWEPVWRVLNLARGRYLSALGNTPGHIQHFSRRKLIDLASEHLRVDAVRSPLPWTVVLGEPLPRNGRRKPTRGQFEL